MQIVYQTDPLGLYQGEAYADPDPLNPGQWLIPGGCVQTPPPSVPEHKTAYWDGAAWQLLDSYLGLLAYSTATGEAVQVDRHGPLLAGYTLLPPGPHQRWHNGQWVDDVPAAVARLYAAQVQTVNERCQQRIVGGFISNALGESHRYPSSLEDQVNLAGSVLLDGPAPFSCQDVAGAPAYRLHSAEQLRQVGVDLSQFKLACLQQAQQLKNQLSEARDAQDVAALEAIEWT